MEDNTPQNEGGVVQRIKESPRTVSALIIILIVAAAIYAFSGPDEQPGTSPTGEEVAVDTTDEQEPEDAQEPAAPGSPSLATPGATSAPTPAGTTPAEATTLPQPTRTDTAFVEVAQAGEGVTHIARRTTQQWLGDNAPDYEISKEHLIYIEDYIKDQLGSRSLSVGATQEVRFDLIADAVAAAKGLSESQLKNLSRYTHALP